MKVNLMSEKEVLSEDTQVITLSGELDIYSAPAFKDEIVDLLAQGIRNVYIDLDNLEFMDSRGLGVFISISKSIKEKGGNLRLVCSNQTILKIFQRTGLSEIFNIYDDREKALI